MHKVSTFGRRTLERCIRRLRGRSAEQSAELHLFEQYAAQGFASPEMAWLHLAAYQEFVDRPSFKFLVGKRAIDVTIALMALIICLPLLLVVAALIKWDSSGSVFFRQPRIGKNFSVFMILKFRTMKTQSSASILQIAGHQPLKVHPDDFRTTRIGHWLRRTKIDELPQLWNVLWGEMSLVGPRPLALGDSSTCPPRYLARFSHKPGITGVWQAYRHNTISGLSKFRFDAYYCRKPSLKMDAWLLLRTTSLPFIKRSRYSAKVSTSPPQKRAA